MCIRLDCKVIPGAMQSNGVNEVLFSGLLLSLVSKEQGIGPCHASNLLGPNGINPTKELVRNVES